MVDWPTDVETRPQQQGIKQFQNLLYSSRCDELLRDYNMSAEELSEICCTRWLSCDHMCWMTQELNKIQGETLCVYMNFVRNIDRYITKRITPLERKPSKFLFILNVGKNGNGSVYLGSDAQPGNHWTTCHVDTDKRVLIRTNGSLLTVIHWRGRVQYIYATESGSTYKAHTTNKCWRILLCTPTTHRL